MHLVLILDKQTRPKTADHYDRFVCAEIPRESCPMLRQLVLQCHIHGPCGKINPRSPCMEDNRCTKHYPKQFLEATVEDEDGMADYRRRSPDKQQQRRQGNTALLPNEGR